MGTLLAGLNAFIANPIDPDSEAGRILGALELDPPADPPPQSGGKVKGKNLAFVPTSSGVSVRAAQGSEMFTFQVPPDLDLSYSYLLVGANTLDRVQIELVPISVTIPGLTPALAPDANGLLQPDTSVPGKPVKLVMPSLVLAVTPSGATLAPSEVAGGGLQVSMDPQFALIGPASPPVLGFGLQAATLFLDQPQGAEVRAPAIQLFITPPSIPALQMTGAAQNLTIGLGPDNGGLTGDFSLAQDTDPSVAAPGKPDFVDHLAAELHLVRSAVRALALRGQVNFNKAVADHLAGLDGDVGPDAVDFTLRLTLNPAWQASLELTAPQGFLYRTAGQPTIARNTLGGYTAFGPLLNAAVSGQSSDGSIQDLALTGISIGGLDTLGVIQSQSVTVYGAELVVNAG